MKKISNKIINSLNISICCIWLIAFLFNFISINVEQDNYKKLYANLLSESSTFNMKVKNDSDYNIETSSEEPLYTDGATAMITAWNLFKQAKTYEIIGYGQGEGTTMGYGLTMAMQNKFCQWSDGTNLVEMARKQTQDFTFGNDILTGSFIYYYENGERYVNDTTNISNLGDSLSIKYEKDYELNDFNFPYSTMLYIINNQTIVKTDYFKINYNTYTKKIESYNVSITLNAQVSCKDYAQNLRKEMRDAVNEAPTFSYLKLNAIIDKNGYIKVLSVSESYKFTYAKMNVECITSSNICYKFLSYNVEPSFIEKI